jgi:hypothetical protein
MLTKFATVIKDLVSVAAFFGMVNKIFTSYPFSASSLLYSIKNLFLQISMEEFKIRKMLKSRVLQSENEEPR